MDIKTITADLAKDEQGVEITIYNKNGEEYRAADDTPATITVTGTDAKKYRAEKHAIQREYMQSRKAKLSVEDVTKNRIRQASAGVTGWHGWESDGTALECTPENVRALLGIEHILEQVEAGITGHSAFFTNN